MSHFIKIFICMIFCVSVFANDPFIGFRGNISSGGGSWSNQNYEDVLSVMREFSIPQDAQWSAVVSAQGEIDVIFIHINGELQSLVNNRGQWQHNMNLDANAWRVHIHHAELKAMVMNPDLGLNRYMILGGIGTKQLTFGQVTMSGSVGVMFLAYNIQADELMETDTYSINNAESIYAGLNLRYQTSRIDLRGKFAVFGTPEFNSGYSFFDYIRDRDISDFYLGTELGYLGQAQLFINVRSKERKIALGPYLDLRYMQTSFQTEFFAGIGIRVQRKR